MEKTGRKKIGQSAQAVKPAFVENTAKTIPEPLEEARWALEGGKSQLFYNEVNKAIWKKLSQKLSIPSTELNKYNAVSRLKQKGLNSNHIHQLESVLNECEIALYTPVHTHTDMQQTFSKAEGLITALDQEFT